jgi:DNA-binding response OmpR family regulator
VDDEPEAVELLEFNLKKAGFEVIAATDGAQALKTARSALPHLIVLDLMLPEIDGLEVCKMLRRDPATARIPIVMLTAKAAEVDRILGLELGADDYLTKPFSPRELVARIQALLRRARPAPASEVIESAGLRLDESAREASFHGRPLALTPREFDLLSFFARHPGRVLTREELLRKVWGYDYLGETRTVDVHVRRLRRKLGEPHGPIETVLGSGYKWVAAPGG